MVRFIFALLLMLPMAMMGQDTAKGETKGPEVVNAPPPNFARCEKPPAGVKRSTIVKLTVTDQGKPDDVSMEKSSGDKCADVNAVLTVQQYTFKPAMKDGKPVASQVRIQVDF